MIELKALMKKREGNDREEDEVSGRNVQTLIRPQLTNPKIFWSKSEDEDFSPDVQKYKTVRDEVLREKVMNNVFRPIRSEVSPKVRDPNGTKMRNKTKTDKKEEEDKERSIHESLRVHKVKRRTSLPFNWDQKAPGEDLGSRNGENLKTYDISYYSTILKRINHQEGSSDYYSANRKKELKQHSVKSASDECIFEDRHDGGRTKEKSEQRERLSVTEPSSPFVSSYSIQLEDANRNVAKYTDSDSGSEFLARDLRKSKSFAEENEPEHYYSRRKKSSGPETRKTFSSSPSSCESSYRSKALLRKTLKSKPNRFVTSQNPQVREVQKSFGRSERLPENVCQYERRRQDESKIRFQSRSQGEVEPQMSDTRQGINADIFQHLLDVLMQKNRNETAEPERSELFTKSLPRPLNHGRGRGGKKEDFRGKSCGKTMERGRAEDSGSGISDRGARGRNAEAIVTRTNAKHRRASGSTEKKEEAWETLPGSRNRRGRKKVEGECVIQIEDKKLWIEICKAVEKVDAKGRKLKKCS